MEKEEKTISIIIKTCNSDKTLVETLESVRDFGEIIALDLHSVDDTIDILKEYRTKIIYADKNELSSGLTQALAEAKGNWILVLEDDEIAPQNLLTELENYISNPKKNKFCVGISKKTFYLKKELKSARIKSELKFFKKGYASFEPDNSFALKLKAGKVYKLNKNFKKKNVYIMKFLESDIKKSILNIVERNQNILKKVQYKTSSLIFKPCFEFLYRYIFKFAILEGRRGLIYSKQKSIETFMLEVMKYEKRTKENL